MRLGMLNTHCRWGTDLSTSKNTVGKKGRTREGTTTLEIMTSKKMISSSGTSSAQRSISETETIRDTLLRQVESLTGK